VSEDLANIYEVASSSCDFHPACILSLDMAREGLLGCFADIFQGLNRSLEDQLRARGVRRRVRRFGDSDQESS